MKRAKICLASTISFALLFFLASPVRAQLEIGDFTIRGEAEFGGVLRGTDGARQKFEEYRDLGETGIAPQLQFMIGGKREDFYLNFDSSNLGRHDQNYIMRFGRYGLLDVEFEWDQYPHVFSFNTAATPYVMEGGDYTLATKPANTTGGTACGANGVCTWVTGEARPIDLKIFNGFGRFKVRYTPDTNWTFTGNYSSQNVAGRRAIGAYFGSSGGTWKTTEIAEPIDYQIHNIDLGAEYAGTGWSLGLRYNASYFHNNISTLMWDNPTNLSGIGAACTDAAGFTSTSTGTDANRGPCRGRMDMYPSNEAHTWILTGATRLPFKSNFMGTVSYGVRVQNDPLLPQTTNTALAARSVSRENLDGVVRPLMINATVVNRYFNKFDLKAFYRYYDYENRSKKVNLPDGRVHADSSVDSDSQRSFPWSYSKQNVGFDVSHNVTRWLSAKMGYLYENMHRERREVLTSNEHTFGPSFDIKPNSWILVRLGYKRSLRDAHEYDGGRYNIVDTSLTSDEMREEVLEELRKFDQAARTRDKFSYYGQLTPWHNLTLFGGFDFFLDEYPRTVIGLQDDVSYVPSVGFTYMPLDWMTLYSNYSWERWDWKMQAMNRTAVTQNPTTDPLRTWRSRGRDQINTVSFGSDMRLIDNLLGLRIQYTFSEASSLVKASGDSVGTPATNYPNVTNRWHEFLMRLEYQLFKNVAVRFGYYFNRFNEKDFGVDIMRVWMGDYDQGAASTNNNLQRSIFLGDRIKRPYTAHVGLLGLRFTF